MANETLKPNPSIYTFSFIAVGGICLAIALMIYWNRFGSLTLSDKHEDWNLFSQYLGGVIGPLISLFTLIITTWIALTFNEYQKSQHEATESYEKRQLTLKLHEQFHDAVFYYQVNSPVWKIYLKWQHLPATPREEYRRAIAMGWIGFNSGNSEQILKEWIPNFEIEDDYRKVHYLNKLNVESLTEHEALTIFLGKWSELWIYVERDIIDKNLLIIFKDWYDYYRPFMMDLSTYIINLRNSEFKNDPIPDWIINNEKLSRLLDNLSMPTT